MLTPYLALPELFNLLESEDSSSLFFQLMLPLVAGYLYLPALIYFYFDCPTNPSKTTHSTVTGLVPYSRSLNSAGWAEIRIYHLIIMTDKLLDLPTVMMHSLTKRLTKEKFDEHNKNHQTIAAGIKLI